MANLEEQGHTVYYPARDTDQSLPELEICRQNLEAIEQADEIHVYWDGTSQGAIFDLGMAFAMRKKIRIKRLPEKSILNLLRSYAQES